MSIYLYNYLFHYISLFNLIYLFHLIYLLFWFWLFIKLLHNRQDNVQSADHILDRPVGGYFLIFWMHIISYYHWKSECIQMLIRLFVSGADADILLRSRCFQWPRWGPQRRRNDHSIGRAVWGKYGNFMYTCMYISVISLIKFIIHTL